MNVQQGTLVASAWLWAGVVLLGVYHGLNPAMGWPLAVARGLDGRRARAVWSAWLPLGAGHLLAMALVLLPFALLSWLMQWSREIRIGAGLLVLLFGVVLLTPWSRVLHRHRWMARIRPTQLALWSFVMASVHGAGLMLLPIFIGLCGPAPQAEASAMRMLMAASLGTALTVALVHTLVMITAGAGIAWLVYRYLGLRMLQRTWLNLDRVWALGLMAAGGAALAAA
ncbi:hypothetical protein [Variovorax sp. OV329]|uniref:hypothetical protein n=1 Tax=Variovorax sp. OV329 TaxID=1882825 RepID=UPI0008E1C38E|nr:hypothetical protein [Variovorax sp. OV329]SFM05135.1 hypothetical protein SAMN05444747_102176 [Variovorax sp. OV329]